LGGFFEKLGWIFEILKIRGWLPLENSSKTRHKRTRTRLNRSSRANPYLKFWSVSTGLKIALKSIFAKSLAAQGL